MEYLFVLITVNGRLNYLVIFLRGTLACKLFNLYKDIDFITLFPRYILK